MKYKKGFILLTLLCIILTAASCEEEFTEIGDGFINGIDIQEPLVIKNISAYSEKINSVQTNNLSVYKLGTYQDPVFGMSESTILTQLTLQESNHDFGQEPKIDSVIMTLPYFSTQINASSANGQNQFELDSVFGQGTFQISVLKSNQFLRNVEPGDDGDFQETQIYYSDQLNDFLPNIITGNPISTSDPITPVSETDAEILIDQKTEEADTLSLSPRIRIKLPVDFFEDKILSKAGGEELLTNQNFVNYFRGIYIKAEQLGNEPVMAMFDLNQDDAGITIHYRAMRNTNPAGDDEELTETFNEFNLNFTGIKTNLYESNSPVDLSNPDTANGEENLYLQGGQGSIAVLNLFDGPDADNDGVSDELEDLRSEERLINEATLQLYVNEDIASTPKNRSNRIFIYDLDNNRLLIDYQIDPTASPNVPERSRTLHLAPLEENDGNPFYKIRLTSHISNIINNDSTNVTLGLNISQNVENARLFDVKSSSTDRVDALLETSLISPRGVVLHGTESANEEKKLKLRIQTTENK